MTHDQENFKEMVQNKAARDSMEGKKARIPAEDNQKLEKGKLGKVFDQIPANSTAYFS